MNKQRKNISRQAATLALCALAASAAPSASAQEAGRLVVFSHLSEPLNASAPLALPSALQASDVTARVASEALYAAAGARRPAWADQARIEARAVGKNRVELRVSTPSPVEDPASTLILEIDVKGEGSSTKQYAVILDPLEMGKPVAKADASDGSAGLQARAQAEAKAPAPRAESDRLVVKSGQILYGIAQSKRPSDVSVQRMMVGMLRANPQAFVQGNVNRLKAGAVMRMPTNDELAGIGQAEAVQAINRQAADFAKWRELAAKPAEVAAPKAAAGEGQVDKVAAAPEAGPDVLRLGKAQAGKRDATDEIAQKSREAEAKARIDELDRMREDVKKAMAIDGGGELAALEAKAAAGQEPKPQETTPVEAAATDQAEGAPDQAQPEAPKPEAPKPEAPKTAPPPAPPAEPEPEPSFMESAIAALSENRLFAAGGLAALLAAAALAARKRKAKKGFSGPTTIVPDAAGAHPPAAAASQEPEVSEFQTHLNSADTYLAFNKLDRAAEEIRQALEIEPKNLDGLIMGARVAARSQDRESLARFVAQIGDLTFKAGPYWDEADGLLAQASRGEPQEEAPMAPPASVDFSADLERSLMDLASATPERPQADPQPSSKLDFEVPSFDLPPAPATSSDPYAGVEFPAAPDPRSESLSFDLSLPDDPPSAPSQPSQTLSFEPASPEPQGAAAEVEGELRTMLDLARAYVDMGDKDGARELLAEIEQKGSPELKAKAKEVLDTL